MKRILPIISFILLTLFTAHSQGKPISSLADAGPIVRFYPNPATTAITFDFQKAYDKGLSIQIYNFLGRKMYEASNVSSKTVLSLTDYNRGVYVYRIVDRSGKVIETGKFQVSK